MYNITIYLNKSFKGSCTCYSAAQMCFTEGNHSWLRCVKGTHSITWGWTSLFVDFIKIKKTTGSSFGSIFCLGASSAWISNHQMLQFSPLCLVLSGFSSSRVSLESKLCVCFQSFVFFPSTSLSLSLSLSLARRMCASEPVSACVCVCVFANERVQALFFFWTSLWCCCLFIYFPACEGPFSAVRAAVGWACVALSAIHQRRASLTDDPVTPAPCGTSAPSWSRAGGVLFLRRCSVTRRASASSPPCLAEEPCASHVKQLFHLWPGGVALLWFPDDNGALVVVGVLFFFVVLLIWYLCLLGSHYRFQYGGVTAGWAVSPHSNEVPGLSVCVFLL